MTSASVRREGVGPNVGAKRAVGKGVGFEGCVAVDPTIVTVDGSAVILVGTGIDD
jgi:hypothetical protein